MLYKHIIQVENKNVGLKVGGGGHKHILSPNQKVCVCGGGGGGGTCPPCHPHRFLRQCIYIRNCGTQFGTISVSPGSQPTCTKVCRIGRGAQLGSIDPVGLRPALYIYLSVFHFIIMLLNLFKGYPFICTHTITALKLFELIYIL